MSYKLLYKNSCLLKINCNKPFTICNVVYKNIIVLTCTIDN